MEWNVLNLRNYTNIKKKTRKNFCTNRKDWTKRKKKLYAFSSARFGEVLNKIKMQCEFLRTLTRTSYKILFLYTHSKAHVEMITEWCLIAIVYKSTYTTRNDKHRNTPAKYSNEKQSCFVIKHQIWPVPALLRCKKMYYSYELVGCYILSKKASLRISVVFVVCFSSNVQIPSHSFPVGF